MTPKRGAAPKRTAEMDGAKLKVIAAGANATPGGPQMMHGTPPPAELSPTWAGAAGYAAGKWFGNPRNEPPQGYHNPLPQGYYGEDTTDVSYPGQTPPEMMNFAQKGKGVKTMIVPGDVSVGPLLSQLMKPGTDYIDYQGQRWTPEAGWKAIPQVNLRDPDFPAGIGTDNWQAALVTDLQAKSNEEGRTVTASRSDVRPQEWGQWGVGQATRETSWPISQAISQAADRRNVADYTGVTLGNNFGSGMDQALSKARQDLVKNWLKTAAAKLGGGR